MDHNHQTRPSLSLDHSFFFRKRIIIIGSSGSIGKSLSTWYLKQGAKVVMVSRNMQEIQQIANQYPSHSICIECDLISDECQLDMVTGALEALGGLDLLINCQGVFFENDLQNTYPQDHDYLIDINLRSFFHISQLCSVALTKSKGCIINISGSSRPQAGMISYSISKSGLNMLTKCLALELSPVRVNAISPGFLDNNFLENSQLQGRKFQRIKDRIAQGNPLKRLGTVTEITKAVIWLSTAGGISGEVVSVDGGFGNSGSCFVNWESSEKMNSRILASGVSGISKVVDWVEQKFEGIVEEKDLVKELLGKSKWSSEQSNGFNKVYDRMEDGLEDLYREIEYNPGFHDSNREQEAINN